MLYHIGEQPVESKANLLTTIAWKIGDKPCEYALEGSVFMGGAAIQWLRDGLKIIETAPEVNRLAAEVEDSGGVFVVPAFVGLGAPHWDPMARGTILGLTRGTKRAHICRATLAGIAFQVAEVLLAMYEDTGKPLEELRVDGGASASDLLMQMQADYLGIPIQRPKVTESTAQGAAYLAGLATDVWNTISDIANLILSKRS